MINCINPLQFLVPHCKTCYGYDHKFLITMKVESRKSQSLKITISWCLHQQHVISPHGFGILDTVCSCNLVCISSRLQLAQCILLPYLVIMVISTSLVYLEGKIQNFILTLKNVQNIIACRLLFRAQLKDFMQSFDLLILFIKLFLFFDRL